MPPNKEKQEIMAYTALYVDENELIGNQKAIGETAKFLWKNGLVLII